MIYKGTIYDKPLNVSLTIDPVALQQLNDAWLHNAKLLGLFCLVVGFLIGAGSVYLYYWRRSREMADTHFLAVKEL
jgi:hypothetical protein